MRHTKRVLSAAILIFVFGGACGLLSQEFLPLKNYSQKLMNFPSSREVWWLYEWHVTGKKTSAVYFHEYNEDAKTVGLYKYRLFANGRISGATPILTDIKGDISDVDIVWFNASGSPPDPSPPAHAGLLFIMYAPEAEYPVRKLIISVAKIDKDGDVVSGFKKIMEVNATEKEPLLFSSIGGTQQGSVIAVVMNFVYLVFEEDLSGINSSIAYYLEFDLDGDQIGGRSQLPYPKGGNLNVCSAYSPFWTGNGWMIPATNTRMVIKTYEDGYRYTDATGNNLFIFTVAGSAAAPGYKIKRRLIFKDNQKDGIFNYRDLGFLNLDENASPSGKKKTYTLKWSHRNYIPEKDVTLDRYTLDTFLTPINNRGRRAGTSTKIDLEPWDHKMNYDSEKMLTGYTNRISNFIPDGNGGFYFASVRSTTMRNPYFAPASDAGYVCEHELSLYSLDPATGDVEIISRKSTGDPMGNYGSNKIRWFKNQIAIIDNLTVYEPEYEYRYFYTTIKP